MTPFYGMREFIFRDLSRFWVTFAQPSVFEQLMSGVREGNVERVQAALNSGGLKPETLTAALVAASSGDDHSGHNHNAEIQELLRKAGAVPPPEVAAETMKSYAGRYQGEQGFELNVTFKDGKVFAALGAHQPLSLIALDTTTFKPVFFDDFGTVTFSVEGCVLKHGSNATQLKRAEGTG